MSRPWTLAMSAEDSPIRCARAFGIVGTPLATCDRPYGHTGAHTSASASFAGGRDRQDEERTLAMSIAIHESHKCYEETMDTADELRGDMFWQPVNPHSTPIPPRLAALLAKRLWGSQGKRAPCIVDHALGEYLRGLSDAGVEGAAQLWEGIAASGEISIWVEPQ